MWKLFSHKIHMLMIPESEYTLTAIRAQGAGGQNVNKVSSAIHLRFDIAASSLPEWLKTKLLSGFENRISAEGVLILKAQQFRTQEANKKDAIKRLHDIVNAGAHVPATRYKTKPTRASQKRRIDTKNRRGELKKLRGKIGAD